MANLKEIDTQEIFLFTKRLLSLNGMLSTNEITLFKVTFLNNKCDKTHPPHALVKQEDYD